MTFLLYLVFLLLPFITGVFAGSKYQPALQMFGAAFNVMAGLSWAIVFLAMAPKTSAGFVFTKFINTSGWNNNGWVFILSFYTPIYGLYGTDGLMHCKLLQSPSASSSTFMANLFSVSEEMKNPSRDGPRAMIWSMIWAGGTAFLSAIVMCFTVGPDWEPRLDQLSSYISWFMDVTGSVYGGGVYIAIIMMGLNVSLPLSTWTVKESLDDNLLTCHTVHDHRQSIHCKRPTDLEDGS